MIFLAAIFVSAHCSSRGAEHSARVHLGGATHLLQAAHVLATNEVLSAWQYLEVYVVGIVVLLLQIGQVSRFMVKARATGCSPHSTYWCASTCSRGRQRVLLPRRKHREWLLPAHRRLPLLGLCNRVVCNRARSASARARLGPLASASSKPMSAPSSRGASRRRRGQRQVSLTRPGSNGGLR